MMTIKRFNHLLYALGTASRARDHREAARIRLELLEEFERLKKKQDLRRG